jgi:hydroxymethylpyrimidine pyrophosphatase-like HAD family hydrolase
VKFVFDIDDTILFSEIDHEGNYHLNRFDPFVVDKINMLYDRGEIIIISTGRHWNHLEVTIEQLKSVGLKYHTLHMGKPVADYYIDDKALTPIEFMQKVI